MSKVVFLPGAGGRKSFWQRTAALLDPRFEAVVLGWPGFGDEPRDNSIVSLTGLVNYVLRYVEEPVDIVAQSMGGVVAMSVILQQPALVRRLILTGTSGGIDVARFGAEDWRAEAEQNDTTGPDQMPRWFIDDRTDLTERLSSITTPTLLIWGELDRTSPPAAGEYLATLLPHAQFVIAPDGGHAWPSQHPREAAALINRFLLAEPAAVVGRF